ncbi:MAG: hypothetical protein AABW90_01100 [Nanoarchaeota archaeon]
MTTDIFDNKILCKNCNTTMKPIEITKNGLVLRAIECQKCNSKILHPKDEQEYNHFTNLKKKQFSVKMRFVGNSYAISIPREIVEFMKEQEKIMDYMVKLCFEEFGILKLNFACHKNGNGNNGNSHSNLNDENKLKVK